MPSQSEVVVKTAADGSATENTERLSGRINRISYIKVDFADTVDFTITAEKTLQNVWVEANVTASKVVAPRQATHDTVGVASLYAATGEPVEDHIVLCHERIKLVLAAGGAAKTGKFIVVMD